MCVYCTMSQLRPIFTFFILIHVCLCYSSSSWPTPCYSPMILLRDCFCLFFLYIQVFCLMFSCLFTVSLGLTSSVLASYYIPGVHHHAPVSVCCLVKSLTGTSSIWVCIHISRTLCHHCIHVPVTFSGLCLSAFISFVLVCGHLHSHFVFVCLAIPIHIFVSFLWPFILTPSSSVCLAIITHHHLSVALSIHLLVSCLWSFA